MNIIRYGTLTWQGFPLFLLVIVVTGCSGSDRGAAEPVSDAPQNPDLPPPTALDCDSVAAGPLQENADFDALPGGIFTGTITDTNRNHNSYFEAWVAEDGRAKFLFYPSGTQISADLIVSGAGFTSAGRAHAKSGDAWSDGSLATEITLEGTVQERESVSGVWSATSGDGGCFTTTEYFAFLYEEESSLEFLAAVWAGDPTLTVEQDGSFFGQDSQGCAWTGRFATIDPRFNMYEVSADIAACSIAGSYFGLAYRDYVFAPERTLRLAIDNDQRAILLNLED